MFETLVTRFISYAKENTRSNPDSAAIPSTQSQVVFAKKLKKELEDLGLSEVEYQEDSGFVVATLPSNLDYPVPTIGFIAHMDTAHFPAENIQPQIVKDYDGHSDILLGDSGYKLSPSEFPSLKNYAGETLITTDGTTLLGADDKAGIAEIITAAEYLLAHPEIPHGTMKLAFGPDEEIGKGAINFNIENFGADFAYTVDGGSKGELVYETFHAAQADLKFIGTSVHPGDAKGAMVHAVKIGMDFHNRLPKGETAEETEGYEGFYHLTEFSGDVDKATSEYILRDHDREKFEEKKATIQRIADTMNMEFGKERVLTNIYDQYYNMGEIIADHMEIVDLAKEAMELAGVTPEILPTRGGTDGSILSFKGLPTPNLFAGGENMHGRFEYVSANTMEKAVEVIINILKLQAQKFQK